MYGNLRQHLGEVFHDLACHKESKILEGHMQPDHVHLDIRHKLYFFKKNKKYLEKTTSYIFSSLF